MLQCEFRSASRVFEWTVSGHETSVCVSKRPSSTLWSIAVQGNRLLQRLKCPVKDLSFFVA